MHAYQKSVTEVLEAAGVGPDGLSAAEAARRLVQVGPNRIDTGRSISAWRIFFAQFQSFIIYVLLFAVVFASLLGEVADAVIILLILVTNTLIGFFQEYSAERSLEALSRLRAAEALVIRDGTRVVIGAEDVVPGDVLVLEAGRRVPADARLTGERGLLAEEGSLTGESLPVSKTTRPIDGECLAGDQKNMVFSSTSIVQGSGLAVVVATGATTEIGKIAAMVSSAEKELTPLQKRLDSFGRRLGTAIVVICVIVYVAMSLKEWLDGGFSMSTALAFALVAVSLAVAAVPTALPTVVTVALSIGVKRLLRKHALVRRLSSVETLGSCDIICSDKTGTLTRNEMTVRSVWSLDGEARLGGMGYSPAGAVEFVSGHPGRVVFEAGLACNNAALQGEEIRGNPTEAALLVSAAKANISLAFVREIEFSFDNRRKLMSVVGRVDGRRMAYTKGAADRLLDHCTHALRGDTEIDLTDELRETIRAAIEERAALALRVLGFAYRRLDADENFSEENLVFAGLQAMLDPPRPEAADALRRAKAAGIRVIMVTGDYEATARAVGREIGITTADARVVNGHELEHMSIKELERVLAEEGVNVFARVAPEHKLKIITALQNLGHTVAMTGDGVNDAPALKKSDIGVALGSGTEVARESGDFILLDDGLNNIVDAIEEGRGIYDNIQKSIMLLLSGNLGEVLIIFLAVLFGLNLPLTAIMLLWINLVTDGAPALAFSVDPYGTALMRRPPIPPRQGLLPRAHLTLLGFLGFVGSMISLGLFFLYGGEARDESARTYAQTMAFNFVVLYELLLVFIIRREYRVPFWTNGWLWFSLVFSVAIQALILVTPLRSYFGTASPDAAALSGLAVGAVLFMLMYFLYALVIPERLRLNPRNNKTGERTPPAPVSSGARVA